ncbi:hypothetical protein QYM36_001470 [Artemia franciscana]|uniref:Peptidase S1 domain-containing protein n=2 Tax=Artemia franciscana TaxID=6661 RepID=A0AA88LK94_ARTSF|nr:hypothetical protein QYM36_001470 [Artemia franciscana]
MGGNSINNTDPGQGNNTSSSIVGGSEALVGSHPWMALIIQDFYPLCGGALITNKHVLTAANCVQLEGIYKVRLGEYNQDDETDPDVIEIPVEKVVIHPKYIQGRTGFKNDIAILVLTNRVVFTDRIVPICLPDGELRETELTNGNVILSGWGSVSSGDEYLSILQEANLNTVEQEDCLKVWKGITEEQICAQAPGNGFCVGDIGGPLTQVIAENGRYYLLGLLSFGRKGKCADAKYPGVFTRITSYLDWIKENIRNN